MKLNKDYWENRYQTNETGWDTGTITTPLKEYIDQLENKSLKILIPGAGNSYEFSYLIKKGFTNVHVIDIAQNPIQNLLTKHPNYKSQILNGDFFELDDTFDLIIEQTFFCALDPNLRDQYVKKVHSILAPNGKITGLLFDFPLSNEGPPFGGSKNEYTERFEPLFKLKKMERAYNSIKPRANKELFFIFEKK
ncbi:methyltransferase domain-containing protein [Flavobacterium chuncheonense]|uniref:Methyltransferase domain-containing protein n=1 Tax=Flavobacterium chuncheonense TaxID=2026653 RepID=A0ABW5YIE5_9FLAO